MKQIFNLKFIILNQFQIYNFKFQILAVFFLLVTGHWSLVIPTSAQELSPAVKKNVVKNFKANLDTYSPFGSSADCSLKSKGDANCDGVVNQFDLSIWEVEFNTPNNPRRSDFNADGVVNLLDFGVWRGTYFPQKTASLSSTCPQAQSIHSDWPNIVKLLNCYIVKTQIALTQQFNNLTIQQLTFAQEPQAKPIDVQSSTPFTSASGNSQIFNSSSNGNSQQISFSQSGNPTSAQLFNTNGQQLAGVSFLESGSTIISTEQDGVQVQINKTSGGALIQSFANPDGSLLAIKSWPTQQSYDAGEPPLSVTVPGQGNIRNILNIQPNGDSILEKTDTLGNVLSRNQIRANGTLVTEDLQNKTLVQSNSQVGFTSLTLDNNLGGKAIYMFYQGQLYAVVQTNSKGETYTAKPLTPTGDSWSFDSNINGQTTSTTVANPITQLKSNTPDPAELIRYINYYKDLSANPNNLNFADAFPTTSKSLDPQIQRANQILTISNGQSPAVLGIVKEAFAAEKATLDNGKDASQPPANTVPSNWGSPFSADVKESVNTGAAQGKDYTTQSVSYTYQANGSTLSVSVTYGIGTDPAVAGTTQVDGWSTNKGGTPTGSGGPGSTIERAPPAQGEPMAATAPVAQPVPVTVPATQQATQTLEDAVKEAAIAAGKAAGDAADTATIPPGSSKEQEATIRGNASRDAMEASLTKSGLFSEEYISTNRDGGFVTSYVYSAYGLDITNPADRGTAMDRDYVQTAIDRLNASLAERGLPTSQFTLSNIQNGTYYSVAQTTTTGTATPTAAGAGVAAAGTGVTTPFTMGGFTGTARTETVGGQTIVTSTIPGTTHGTATFTQYLGSLDTTFSDDRGTFSAHAGSLTSVSLSGAGTSLEIQNGSLMEVARDGNGNITQQALATPEQVAQWNAAAREQGLATGAEQTAINPDGTRGVTSHVTAEGFCFLPGTLISTPNGPTAIETLKPGNKVYSYNEKTGQKQISEFKKLDINFVDEYLIINGKIHTTTYHPFYVITSTPVIARSETTKQSQVGNVSSSANGNQEGTEIAAPALQARNDEVGRVDTVLKTLRADQLKIGDILLDENRNHVPVSSIQRINAPKTTVYNLMNVSLNNNFFAEGILVHNYSSEDEAQSGVNSLSSEVNGGGSVGTPEGATNDFAKGSQGDGWGSSSNTDPGSGTSDTTTDTSTTSDNQSSDNNGGNNVESSSNNDPGSSGNGDGW